MSFLKSIWAPMFIENLSLRKYIKRAQSFYPKPDLPKNTKDWEWGHVLVSYYAKKIMPKLLLPSWSHFVTAQVLAGVRPPLTDEERGASNVVYWSGLRRIDAMREKARATDNYESYYIEKYRVAQCGTLALYAKGLLARDCAYNPKVVNFSICNGDVPVEDDHNFCVYHLHNPKATFNDLMENLNDPDVRVCDLWTCSYGTPAQVFGHFAKMWVVEQNKVFSAVKPGMTICLEDWTERPVRDMRLVGVFEKRERADAPLGVRLLKTPAMYETTDKVARSNEPQRVTTWRQVRSSPELETPRIISDAVNHQRAE